MYGGDACDAYAHDPAPKLMAYLTIDDAYFEWYKKNNQQVFELTFCTPCPPFDTRASRTWENIDETD